MTKSQKAYGMTVRQICSGPGPAWSIRARVLTLRLRAIGIALVAGTLFLNGCTTEQATPVSTNSTSTQPNTVKTAKAKPAPTVTVQPAVNGSVAANNPQIVANFISELSPKSATVAKTPPAPKNLWTKVRVGFKLDHDVTRPRVRYWIAFYSAHNHKLQRDLVRAKPFLWSIVRAIDKRHMPTELTLLPEVESAYNPFARSDASKATGLWQFMAGTASRFGLRRNWWYDGRRNITRSTNAALDYLNYLAKMFHGNWLLALAAYNAGEGTIQQAIDRNLRHGKPVDFWDLRLPQQTEQYVPQLLALAALVSHPQRYGIELPYIPNKPELQAVKLPGQINLALAAKLAGISSRKLRNLNPGFRRWATAPSGPNQLLLPKGHTTEFKRNLANIPASERVTWRRHLIHAGDTLSRIAFEYHTTSYILQKINHLHGSLIRVGHSLLIPESEPGVDSAQAALIAEGTGRTPIRNRIVRYTVKSGNSLWTIAQRWRVSVNRLRRWNDLQASALIKPGDRLVIYTNTTGDHRTTHLDPPSPRSMMHGRNGKHYYYTVATGDSLWTIANRFGVSVQDLEAWNGLRHNASIRPGQTLWIADQPHRVYYRVRKGDSLSEIAHRYSVSVAAIRRWNGLAKGRYLHPGQRLEILAASNSQSNNS